MSPTPTIAGYPSLCAGATVGQERAGSPDAAGALRLERLGFVTVALCRFCVNDRLRRIADRLHQISETLR